MGLLINFNVALLRNVLRNAIHGAFWGWKSSNTHRPTPNRKRRGDAETSRSTSHGQANPHTLLRTEGLFFPKNDKHPRVPEYNLKAWKPR